MNDLFKTYWMNRSAAPASPDEESLKALLQRIKEQNQVEEQLAKIRDVDSRIKQESPHYDRGYEKMFYGGSSGKVKVPRDEQLTPAPKKQKKQVAGGVESLRQLAREQAERRQAQEDRIAKAIEYSDVIGSSKGLIPIPKEYQPPEAISLETGGRALPMGINPRKLNDEDRAYLASLIKEYEEK